MIAALAALVIWAPAMPDRRRWQTPWNWHESTSRSMTMHGKTTDVPADQSITASGYSQARMHEYLAGGSLHNGVDRVVGVDVLAALPCAGLLARAQRRYASSAVKRMAACGIRQFLDLGAGLPTNSAPALAIARADPAATIVMVDNDLETCTLARRLAPMWHCSGLHVVHADLIDSDVVCALHASAEPLLDLRRPLGILAIDVLQYVIQRDRLRQALDGYRAVVAPGSMLAVTALGDNPTDHSLVDYLAYYCSSGTPVRPLGVEELGSMLSSWTATPDIEILEDLPALATVIGV